MHKDLQSWEIYSNELARQENEIQLIASENYASKEVMDASGGVFTNKYSEGYPLKRYYGGNQFADQLELLAIERAKKIFGAQHANVQPHSGSSANMAALYSVLERGDKIMGLNLSQGGHLTHGLPVNFSGKYYSVVAYNLHPQTHLLDYDEIARIADKEKPKLIICGYTAYPRKIDFAKFGKIASSCGAILMADIAHIAGLIAGGAHEGPFPHADIVTSTTHKTLRGPRGAIIMCKENLAKQVDKAVFPGLQGGPLMNQIMARSICFYEAMQPSFKTYSKQIILNAQALASSLDDLGFELITGGTDNHLMLIDLRPQKINGKEAQIALDEAGITTNRNTIPYDPQPPFITSGLRIGTAAMTTRGMKEEQMEEIAHLISDVLHSPSDAAIKKKAKADAKKLCAGFPIYASSKKAK